MDQLWVHAIIEWRRHQERSAWAVNQMTDSTLFALLEQGLKDDRSTPNNFKQPIRFAATIGSRLLHLMGKYDDTLNTLTEKFKDEINQAWLERDEAEKVSVLISFRCSLLTSTS